MDDAPVETDRPELGWVLVGQPHDLRAALRAVHHRAEVRREVVLDDGRCAELKESPPDLVRARVERKLGHPVEARLDCDVARYPLGRGYVLILVDGPAEGLEDAIDAEGPMYREIVRPSAPADLVRVCLPDLSVGDPLSVVADLKIGGYGVRKVFEVGGCAR